MTMGCTCPRGQRAAWVLHRSQAMSNPTFETLLDPQLSKVAGGLTPPPYLGRVAWRAMADSWVGSRTRRLFGVVGLRNWAAAGIINGQR